MLQNCTSQIFRAVATRVGYANWASSCTPSTQRQGEPIRSASLSRLFARHHPSDPTAAWCQAPAGPTDLARDNTSIKAAPGPASLEMLFVS